MADKKISQLPLASTPLAGSETLPIVQTGATVQVSVTNLTAGRGISATSVTNGLGAVGTPSYTFTGDTNTGMWSPSADAIAFSTAGVEQARITNSGRLGIGVTNPGTTLGIVSNTSPSVSVEYYDATNAGATYRGRKARGSFSAPTAVLANDYILALTAAGYGDTGFGGNIGLAGFRASENFTDAARGTNFVIETTANGTNTRAERARVTSEGVVGIGTNSPNAAARLDVTSTTSGFLPPRMTTAQRDAISTPPDGLMLYNSTTNKLQVRAAGSWVDLH